MAREVRRSSLTLFYTDHVPRTTDTDTLTSPRRPGAEYPGPSRHARLHDRLQAATDGHLQGTSVTVTATIVVSIVACVDIDCNNGDDMPALCLVLLLFAYNTSMGVETGPVSF